MAEFRGRGGCPCADEETFSGLDSRARAFLKTLHSVKSILNEEECRSAGEAGISWDDELAVILATKPPSVVQEALGILEEILGQSWCGSTAKKIQMLSELYQERLVTEDEVKRMKRGGDLPGRVVIVQCTKPPEVVTKTADVLDKCGYIEAMQLRALNELFTRHLTAEECSEVAGKGRWEWEDHLALVLSTKPAEVAQEACQVLEKHGCDVEKLKTLNALFTRHLLTAEECSKVARNERWWEDHLARVLSTKSAEVVQEACQVLEQHGCPVMELKMLSELYQERLVTEDDVKRMRREGRDLPDRLVHVQYTKPPQVVTRTADILDKWGYNAEARQLRDPEMSRGPRGVRSGRRYGGSMFSTDLGYGGSSTLSSDLGYGGSSTVSSDFGYGGSATLFYESGYGGSRTASYESGYGGSSTAATSTHSTSYPVKRYQEMTMHPHEEEPSLSQKGLSSEQVEEVATSQGSKVLSQPAGGGSDPPKEPDTATVKAAEAALDDHCWIPFDVQSQSIGPEGGKLCLQPSAGAMRGEEGETILLEVPPGAVCPSESAEVHSAVIPDGPFTLPEGYQLGSMVVYIHYDSRRVTQPLKLRLPHWYGGEDHVQDGLAFAVAPHTLKEGESVYHFELLEGGRFAKQRQCGVLQISGHCSLFAAVFKVKASSLYYASLWTHQVAGNLIANNEMDSKVVITYADQVWIEVLEEYWKDWERCKANTVKFRFSDKKVQGMLSSHCGDGWEASMIKAKTVCSDEVAYGRDKRSRKNLEYEVEQHIYPPAIDCVVMYDFPPDCSRGATKTKLSIEGTSKGRISFPIKVYEVKTPHPPSSPSASTSSFVETCSHHPVNEETDCRQLNGSRDTTAASHSPLTPPPDMVATTPPQTGTATPPSVVPVSDDATTLTPPTPPAPDTADVIEALDHQLDAQWRHFGAFLRVNYQIMEAIKTGNGGNPADCMLDLLGKWTSNQAGTGTLPRTWKTVVEAVKKTGFGAIAEDLALKHGVNLPQ